MVVSTAPRYLVAPTRGEHWNMAQDVTYGIVSLKVPQDLPRHSHRP